MRYLGIPYKNGELGLHYLPEQIVWMSHSYLLINIDMWGRIILICSNFNLKQVCGGSCSLSSPQMFWLVQLLKVVELSWPNWHRPVLKTNIKKKQKPKKLSWERNVVNLLLVTFLMWEKFDKAAYSLYALLVRQQYLLFYSFCSKKIWKGQQKLK